MERFREQWEESNNNVSVRQSELEPMLLESSQYRDLGLQFQEWVTRTSSALSQLSQAQPEVEELEQAVERHKVHKLGLNITFNRSLRPLYRQFIVFPA